MFRTLFGDLTSGRLARLPYLGYLALLMLIGFGVLFGMIMLVSGIERAMGGDLQQTQAMLMEKFGVIGMIATVLFLLALSFANLNLAAKRIRDMGLPGWWTVLGIVVLTMAVGFLFPGQMVEQPGGQMVMQPSLVSNAVQLVILAALLLIPSDTFRRNA